MPSFDLTPSSKFSLHTCFHIVYLSFMVMADAKSGCSVRTRHLLLPNPISKSEAARPSPCTRMSRCGPGSRKVGRAAEHKWG
jgi:hypothetical protein